MPMEENKQLRLAKVVPKLLTLWNDFNKFSLLTLTNTSLPLTNPPLHDFNSCVIKNVRNTVFLKMPQRHLSKPWSPILQVLMPVFYFSFGVVWVFGLGSACER